MTLRELIAALESADPERVVPYGFRDPHSYRGIYADVAFEPAENITVGEMLAAARSALGATFQGYKGGDYTMREYTDCWLSEYGHASGETIGPTLLRLMLAGAQGLTVEFSGEDVAALVERYDLVRRQLAEMRADAQGARIAAILQATAATLHVVAEWGSVPGEDLHEMARRVAEGEVADWTFCPVCEEVRCDADCPLGPVRGTDETGASGG